MSIQDNGAPASSASLSRSFLIVTINKRYLAFDAASVTRVTTVKEFEGSDDPKTHKIVDLTMQWNNPNIQTDSNASVVILTNQEMECRIRVSHIHGRLDIQPSQVLPLPAHFRNGEGQWYRGMILFENSVAFILNPNWIIEEYGGSTAGDEQGDLSPLSKALENGAHDRRLC